jgi:hypothetical protein
MHYGKPQGADGQNLCQRFFSSAHDRILPCHQKGCRHRLAVDTRCDVPTVTIGTTWTVGIYRNPLDSVELGPSAQDLAHGPRGLRRDGGATAPR